jgi:hypothetical protein
MSKRACRTPRRRWLRAHWLGLNALWLFAALSACTILEPLGDLVGGNAAVDAEGEGAPEGEVASDDGATLSDGDVVQRDATLKDTATPSADATCNADLATDPHNCGACGHDCLGGACTASACAPILVASSQGKPFTLAVNETAIYWTNNEANTIGYAPIDGGAAGVFVSFAGYSPTGLALDANHIYWTRWLEGLIGWVALDGGAPSSFSSQGIGPGTLAVQSGTLAVVNDQPFTCQNAYSVVKMAVDGGGASIVAEGGTELPSVVLAMGSIYWANRGTASCDAGGARGAVEGVPVRGGGRVVFTASEPDGLATDGTSLFWVNLNGGALGAASIVSQPLDGGVARVLASNLAEPLTIAVDDANVYWADWSNESIMRVRKDGSQAIPTTVATAQTDVYSIALDAHFVYWADSTAGTIMKVAK